MANYTTLKAAIREVIKTNANNEITGALLQQSLLSMINSLGAYYQFAGLATPSTNPGTPDQNVCYLASTAGTYSNFGGIVLNSGEVAILAYNGSWTKYSSGFASEEKVSQLDFETAEMMSDKISVPGVGQRTYAVLANGKYGTNRTYEHAIVPVTVGEKYVITAIGSAGSRYGFLASLAAPVSGGDIDLVSGTAMTEMTTGEKAIVTIPPGCVALIFNMGNSNNYSFQPKLEKVDNLANLKDTLFIEQSLSGYTPINYLISASGNWGENNVYKHIIIPVNAGETYKIVANSTKNCIYAFLTSDSCVKNTPAPLVANTSRATINSGESSIFTIPDTCTYLYIYYGGTDGAFLPESLSIWPQPIIQELYNQGIESPSVRTLTIPMELGNLMASTGELNFSYSNEKQNLARLRSPLFIGISSSDQINSIQLGEGEGYYIFCYDSDFAFLGYVTDTNIIPGTAWVKFVLTSTNNFSCTKDLSVTVTKYGEVKYAKNAFTPETLLRYSFEVKRPFLPQTNSESNYAGNPERIWDNGVMYLPYNYSRDGKPCPLILWCHGTGGLDFTGGLTYTDYLQFLAKNGYAVIDCSGITSYYGTDIYNAKVTGLYDSKSNPLLYSCISSMYEWVTKNFNVEREVHILSKSAGGLASMYLAYNGPFKVKSMALLAPALLMAGQSFRVTGKVPLDFWLGQLGYDSPDITYPLSPTDRSYVLANYTNLIGYDAFFSGTDIDYQATLSRMYGIEESATGSTTSERLANAYAADSQLMAIFDGAKKNLPVPTKIWIAQDDGTVPYMWAQKLVGMAQRGGYHCFLRTMPNGTGGHHSVDSAASALHANYTCDNGEVVDIPVAYAEACDWFKQW